MKPEQNLINIGINILQVKKKDLIVQDATAMTMIDGKKADYLVDQNLPRSLLRMKSGTLLTRL
jgi:hypothetical protein